MKRLINTLMGAVKHYTTTDFAMFKIYICLVGILIGSYFAPFWIRNIVALWVAAIASGTLVIIQLIRYARKEMSSKQKE